MREYDYKRIWQRQIDKIYFYSGRMKVTCSDGEILTGKGGATCLGTDTEGEDVDGVVFDTDDGRSFVLIEDDITNIEFLDGPYE